jgi:hypothetical protein
LRSSLSSITAFLPLGKSIENLQYHGYGTPGQALRENKADQNDWRFRCRHTSERLEFQYNPDDIADDKSTDYAEVEIPGMSHPRYQYVSGKPRKIAFKLHLFKGPVKEKVHWLRSLLYPEHAGWQRHGQYDLRRHSPSTRYFIIPLINPAYLGSRLNNAPHRVLFIFGDLYPGVECVVSNVKARYFHMFDRDNLLPQHAEVDLVLEEYVDESVNYTEVRQ